MDRKRKEHEEKSKAPKKATRQSAPVPEGPTIPPGRRRLAALRAVSPVESDSETDSERLSEEPDSTPSPVGKAYDPADDTTDSSDDFAGLEEERGEEERPRKRRKSNTGGKLSAMYDLLKDNNKQLKV